MQLESGMIIKMSGLEVKKENGVFEVENVWEKDCSVYKLKKDGTRIKHGLDIFSFKKIEEYGQIITASEVSVAISEVNKQLKDRKQNETVISYISTDKKEFLNKGYIRVIKSIQTTRSIYAIPKGAIFQLSVLGNSTNILLYRVGKRGEVLSILVSDNTTCFSHQTLNNLLNDGYIEIVDRVEQTRNEIEQTEEITAIEDQTVKSEQVTEKTPKQIKVKSITFKWSESQRIKDNTVCNTFAEANDLVLSVAYGMGYDEGYRKTSFIIEWEDGRTHEGRIDIESKHSYKSNPIGEHVKSFYEHLAGLKKPDHYSWEVYNTYLKNVYNIDEVGKEEMRQILNTYLLNDITEEDPTTPDDDKSKGGEESISQQNEPITTITDSEIPPKAEETDELITVTMKTGTGKNGNGIELYFTDKPSEEIREQMKSHGFRWAKYNRCWWTIETPESLTFAESLTQTANNSEPEKLQ